MNISGWGQSLRATLPATIITPQNYVAVAQAHIAAGDRANAEKSYNAAIQLATAELARNPGHPREIALAHISAEYAAFLARENDSDASSIQHPSVPINNSASAAHRPNFSPYSPPVSIQAGTEGKIVVQNCQGTINAPVHGKNNTVNVHYYSPNSEARQPHAVSLGSLRNALYQHYQLSNLSIQRVSGEIASLKDCYINLAIVESQAQREKDKKELEKQAATFERLPSSEQQRLESTNLNKLIALEKLFEAQKLRDGSEGVPKRILIQGRAGIGKTTLCKKLVYEYHENGLWQDRFESVLWVPLRQLKAHSPKRLEVLLCNQYFVGYESSQAQTLAKAFYMHQDKTLFILDGLDEIVGELNEGRPLKDFLQTLLNQAHVVITSRPAGVDTKLLGQLDLVLETVGFNPDNVQAYIQKFAPKLDQAAIQYFIDRTPLIQGLVNIPIQLDALCYSWDSLPKEQEIPTMAMLYEAMVDKLWRKDGVRLEKQDKGKPLASNVIQISSKAKLEKLMEDEIHYLGYLAFKGLEKGKIEFSSEELDQFQAELEDKFPGKEFSFSFTDDLKKTSYLHTADAHRPESERHYHFLHLTFQEFFAAKFLVQQLQAYAKVESASVLSHIVQKGLGATPSRNELEAFIATHKYNPRYEIVWWMVAGLLKGVALENFFNVLNQSPRDLIGSRHQQVMIGCLNEARTQLNKTTVEMLEKGLIQWFHFELECSENSWSGLGRQRTFPEHLLLNQLKGKEGKIIRILRERSFLSGNAISGLIFALQGHHDKQVRWEALWALRKQKPLSKRIIFALVSTLRNDHDENIRASAVYGLELDQRNPLYEVVISALICALQNEDTPSVRSALVKVLSGQKTLSEAAISALICAFQNEDTPSVRSALVKVLSGQKTLSEAAISALICALQDGDTLIRSALVEVLGVQKTLSEAAISALICMLKDGNQKEDARVAAARTLGIQTLSEPAISNLIGVLRDGNGLSIRAEIASALSKQKALSEDAISALLRICADEDWPVGQAVKSALRAQKALSEPVISTLIYALWDWDNESARRIASWVLRGQRTLSEPAFSALICCALRDDKGFVRRAAASILEEAYYETLPESAISSLICALQDDLREEVRVVAAKVLGKQKMLQMAAIPALVRALENENKDIKIEAARALGKQEMLPEAAIPAFIRALQDENWFIRDAAVNSLKSQKILHEPVVSALIRVLQDDNEKERAKSVAAWTLARQDTRSETVISVLIHALTDEKWVVRKAAASALGEQKMLGEPAISALIRALNDNMEGVILEAARALGRQDGLSDTAIFALIRALQYDNYEVEKAAASALGGQKALREPAISALIRALVDDRKNSRKDGQHYYEVIEALGRYGTLPEAVIFALIHALRHDNEKAMAVAARALRTQKMLPEAAIFALICALQHDNSAPVRSAATEVLGLHLNQLYRALPSLALGQIQTLYTSVLFPHSYRQIAPLYIQDRRLHFYTETGPGQSDPLTPEQTVTVTQALLAAQPQAEMMLKEKPFLIEERLHA
ncbi:HEAT repeat domain-containing protein [Mycoavidus cysteinexigens]|uniref:HEAT repeat domain-containing protein n=1 Tax=Mycoavidus cysteinexigens TaxID=1553431 RepID=UPI001375C518|nr:HEAT repeat domain-containing protein [Mycoavidus cysteinexigens]